jgi:hypothetical protein
VELGKSGCFVGEGITVTYKLYSRMDARSIVLKRPAFKNCSVLEMVDQYDSSAVVELYNGSPYYTNLIRKVHLFPLQAGAIPLDFAEVLTTVNFVRSNLPSIDSKNASAIQNKNYGKSSSQRTVSIRSEPRVLNVKQLPVETVPASFKGAVGEFNLTLSADQLSVLPRSLVKLQLRVLGKGNFPLLLPPQLQWPMGVDSTDYQSKEVYDPYRYPLSGYKEFEFRFTAPDTGSYFFPPVSFSYYNPEKSSYQTLRSNGLRVEVHTGSTNEKIVLHKPAPEQLPKQYYWFIGVVLIVIGVIFSQVVAIRKEHQLEPITEFLVPIPELPKDYFLEARIAYFSEEKELFVDSLLKAIWNFFEQEWKLNPANHTKADLEKMMNQRQVDDSLKIELMHLLSQCEWMRYATAEADIDKCKELLFEAERLTELLKP